MHCTKCGFELEPNNNFCGNCGAPTPSSNKMPRNEEVKVKDNFEEATQNEQINVQQNYSSAPQQNDAYAQQNYGPMSQNQMYGPQEQMNPYYEMPRNPKRRIPGWAIALIVVISVLLIALIGMIVWKSVDPVGYLDTFGPDFFFTF